jgi:hypothetical protein
VKAFKLVLSLAVGSALVVGLAAGCNSSSGQIPLAKVDAPPPLPVQDKAKSKAPPGSSPSVLPQQ